MEEKVTGLMLFLVGLCTGIGLYQLLIRWSTRASYITRCTLCKWRHRKERRPGEDGEEDRTE